MKTNLNSLLKSALVACAAFVTATAVSSHASAAEDAHGWVGATLGLSIPNYDSTTARPIYGITAGAKLGSEWGLGAYYFTSAKDETSAGVTSKFNYDLYGVELAYYFEGEARGVYIGGRLGTSKLSVGPSASTSPMNWGLMGGYNYMIGDHFSLGGDLSYMALPSSSSVAANGTTTSLNAFSMLNFMATAKLWF